MTPDPLAPGEVGALLGVSRETLARLETYLALLAKWNRAINLVGAATLADPWRRHILDSGQILPHLPPAPADRPLRLADLGSGAGLPGMVLAILGAGEVHLLESDRRKAQFLREVSRETGAGAQVHEGRIEQLSPLSADCVTARALAPLDRLLDYATRHLRPGGTILFLKGRSVESELTDAGANWSMKIERYRSRSDPEGMLLRLTEIVAKGKSKDGKQ